MMKRRKLISEDPRKVTSVLKAELIADERQRMAAGLRARIVFRGRESAQLATAKMPPSLIAAEDHFAEEKRILAQATHQALGEQVSSLSHDGMEHLVQVFLHAQDWRYVRWIKRSGPVVYALATPSGQVDPTLVGAHVGGAPVGRRTVGELRAGLEAKDLDRSLLIAAQDLAPEAQALLAEPGGEVRLLCGATFLTALMNTGVGVCKQMAPVDYLDTEFFAEIA